MTPRIDYAYSEFSCGALQSETLSVARWHGEEAISRPYRFEVRLASKNAQLDYQGLVGSVACLTFIDRAGTRQPYHGVITQSAVVERDEVYTFYRVVLEPRLALLRQVRHSRTWLDTGLPELIRSVLSELGEQMEGPRLPDGEQQDVFDFAIRLPEEDERHSRRSFTCQFEESSFDFLSRRLEYFGVYYYFEQHADREAVVFCGAQRFEPSQAKALHYRPLSSTEAELQVRALSQFHSQVDSLPSTVRLRDFSASQASLDLNVQASVRQACGVSADEALSEQGEFGELGFYGEHFGSREEGLWLANIRAQALGCRRHHYRGEGRLLGIRAGYPMRLHEHFRCELNADYRVCEIQHEGSQPLPGQRESGEHSSRFTQRLLAIPATVQFRPLRSTPWPRVQGIYSAIVEGDELDRPLLNEHGCYRVQFPFARDHEDSGRRSAWVRPMSLSSGERHGMHFPLFKGAEVLVGFLGGDPDRPVITGTAANSDHPNPINEINSTQRGFSSPGGHYLAMEDSATGPMMCMASPVGNSRVTLGSGARPGLQMSTGEHLDMRSSTLQKEVPGLYWERIGLAAPASDDEPEKVPEQDLQEQVHDNEKEDALEPGPAPYSEVTLKGKTAIWEAGSGWKEHGANALGIGAPIFMRGVLAAEQFAFNAGALKQDISLMGCAQELSLAGPKVAFEGSLWNEHFYEGKKTLYASRSITGLRSFESVLTYEKDTKFATYKSEIYSLEAEKSIVLRVGEHTLTFNQQGIKISAPTTQIILDARDVYIRGNLLVSGKVRAMDSLQLVGDADISGGLQARTGEFSQGLKSPDFAAGLAPTPVLPSTAAIDVNAQESLLEGILQALDVQSELAEGLRKTANAMPRAGG